MTHQIQGGELEFVWISSYYDGPMEGLCNVYGELMAFAWVEGDTYEVTPLTLMQKARWLVRKRMFELCVGKHWSFPQRGSRSYFYWRRPAWLHKALFWAYYKVTGAA